MANKVPMNQVCWSQVQALPVPQNIENVYIQRLIIFIFTKFKAKKVPIDFPYLLSAFYKTIGKRSSYIFHLKEHTPHLFF